MRLLTAGSLVRVQLGEPIEKSVSFYLRTFLFCIMYRTDRRCFFFFIHPTLAELFVIHIKLNAYLVTFTYLDPAYELGNYHLFLFVWDEIKFFRPAFELFVHRLPRETRTETSLMTMMSSSSIVIRTRKIPTTTVSLTEKKSISRQLM